ncbi:MAG TPA: DUF2927 domain-containing protein [Gemmatimonadota bacterium]|nr:DUF2927 domain-containing protein [Gemmatimonadota bacterium]
MMNGIRPAGAVLALLSATTLPWNLGCSRMQVGTTFGPAPGSSPSAVRYTNAEIDYFLEVAMGVEFAHGARPRVIKRWPTGELPAIRMEVMGSPTAQDLAVIRSVIDELNAIAGLPLMAIDSERPNVPVRFVPRNNMRSYSSLVPRWGAGGFVSVELNKDFTIERGQVLIASDIPFRARKPIIREEMTQLLGLLNDSSWYSESIFNDSNFSTEFAPIDRSLIEMLYRPEMRAGLDEADTRKVLRKALR